MAASYTAPEAASHPRPITSTTAFHRSMPGYRQTDLVDFPGLASELGLGRVTVKDESNRFGLPAFKALGASWAIARVVWTAAGRTGTPATWGELESAAHGMSELTVVAATDGNHGRALAHFARLLGLASRIYVPDGVGAAARAAISAEGARLIESPDIYDRVVEQAAASVVAGEFLVQDTSWPGYTDVPKWIVDGYGTLLDEAFGQLEDPAGVIVVPTGVGSLLQSVIENGRGARILAVEPGTAACVTASLLAGYPVTVDTSAPTSMAGLNCGTPSEIAWPVIAGGTTGAVTVDDADAARAAADLAAGGVLAGPCGAASLAGLRRAAADDGMRSVLGLNRETTVVLLSTEGTM
jgi:diaminopropionate ammonia-lyase